MIHFLFGLRENAYPCIGEQDKLQLRRRLEVVEFIFACTVGEEGVFLAAQLPYHAAEGEEGAEDQFRLEGQRS